MDRIEKALAKYDAVMKQVDATFGTMRQMRYQNILENKKRFEQIQKDTSELITNLKPPIPTTKLT